jgi:Na+/pantothenate symporter
MAEGTRCSCKGCDDASGGEGGVKEEGKLKGDVTEGTASLQQQHVRTLLFCYLTSVIVVLILCFPCVGKVFTQYIPDITRHCPVTVCVVVVAIVFTSRRLVVDAFLVALVMTITAKLKFITDVVYPSIVTEIHLDHPSHR